MIQSMFLTMSYTTCVLQVSKTYITTLYFIRYFFKAKRSLIVGTIYKLIRFYLLKKKAKTMINLSRSFSKKIKMPQQMVIFEDNNNF
jgi:hypothetical protein